MAWFKSTQISIQDGNDTIYPIQNPSLGSKMYSETSVNDMAVALGTEAKISEMADKIRGKTGGVYATEVIIYSSSYTVPS